MTTQLKYTFSSSWFLRQHKYLQNAESSNMFKVFSHFLLLNWQKNEDKNKRLFFALLWRMIVSTNIANWMTNEVWMNSFWRQELIVQTFGSKWTNTHCNSFFRKIVSPELWHPARFNKCKCRREHPHPIHIN